MILKQKKLYVFHALTERLFTNEKGENIPYWQVLVFPVEGNGTVGAEQQKIKVHKDAVTVLKNLKQGDRVFLEIGAFVKETDYRVYAVSNEDVEMFE